MLRMKAQLFRVKKSVDTTVVHILNRNTRRELFSFDRQSPLIFVGGSNEADADFVRSILTSHEDIS